MSQHDAIPGESPGDVLDQGVEDVFDDTPVPPGARKALWALAALLALVLTVWMLTSCSGGGNEDKLDVAFDPAEQELIDTVVITPAELAAADGSGENAWVAVDGVVYDIGAYAGWDRNTHYGVQAGTDATAAFEGSPHGADRLVDMPVVGSLGD